MVRSARLWPPPLVVAGYVDNSPTFCHCSRGWVKAVFTEALGEEVDVALAQAVAKGASGESSPFAPGVTLEDSLSRHGPRSSVPAIHLEEVARRCTN